MTRHIDFRTPSELPAEPLFFRTPSTPDFGRNPTFKGSAQRNFRDPERTAHAAF